MSKPVPRWVHVKELTKHEKLLIALRCEAFIAEQLVPRFLPEIRRPNGTT